MPSRFQSKLNRKTAVVVVCVAIAVVICVAIAGALIWKLADLYSPCGEYDEPRITSTDITYWKFSHGRVELVTQHGCEPHGTYAKTGGNWVWRTPSGIEYILRPTPKELRVYSTNGQETMGSPMRRLYLVRIQMWFT